MSAKPKKTRVPRGTSKKSKQTAQDKAVAQLMKEAAGRALGALASASRKRPANFFELDGETQWAIDKSLGILDWDGTWNT